MVLDVVTTHRESKAEDRLSGQPSRPVLQTPPLHCGGRDMTRYETAADDQRAQVSGQTCKNVGKEDPMSHRIIEKRRRDRMNNCLADLSRLIPAEYMKKGRGRVEKTEIIEMAIKHMKYLQSNVSPSVRCQPRGTKQPEPTETVKAPEEINDSILIAEQYKMGFLECLTETMQYLAVEHGYSPSHGLCLSLITHLQNHCSQMVKGKPVIRGDIKDEIILEINRYNANLLMSLEVDRNENYEETNQQQKSSSKSLKSHSSNSTSNDQDRCSMSSTTDSFSSNGSMYKFKTEIKQRFSAENSSVDSAEYYATETPDRKKRRRIESSNSSHEDRQEVPIFALHNNGSYYIPLTVNRDVISPVLDHVLLTENSSSVIVHPISISVNFQATANQF